jgi:regulator of PEP synthase PpsR (kinase-PPPase family)
VTSKARKTESYFHLHLLSDSTGETLLAVGRAAAAQFSTVVPLEHVFPLIRNSKQLEHALIEIESNPGIVLYTLVDEALGDRLQTRCRELGVPCLSVLGPLLSLFHNYLGTETTPIVGGQHMLNAGYFRRIDALNFTMMHDDGQHIDDIEQADVVRVGV